MIDRWSEYTNEIRILSNLKSLKFPSSYRMLSKVKSKNKISTCIDAYEFNEISN